MYPIKPVMYKPQMNSILIAFVCQRRWKVTFEITLNINSNNVFLPKYNIGKVLK